MNHSSGSYKEVGVASKQYNPKSSLSFPKQRQGSIG